MITDPSVAASKTSKPVLARTLLEAVDAPSVWLDPTVVVEGVGVVFVDVAGEGVGVGVSEVALL